MFNIFANTNGFELPQDNICYIIGKDGIYLRKNMDLCDSLTKVDKISFLNDVVPYAKMKIEPIPFSYFCNIVNFFIKVYSIYKTESIIHLYYNQEKKDYKLFCTKQKVTGAHVDYEELPPSYTFGEGYSLISSIHSHSNFGAFHSGGDHADEKHSDGLHMTIGNVDSNKITISCSVVINGTRFMADPCEYVQDLEMYEYTEETPVVPTIYSYWTTIQKIKEDEKPTMKRTIKYSIPEKYDEKLIDSWLKNIEGDTYESRMKKLEEARKLYVGNDYSFYKGFFDKSPLRRSFTSYGEGDAEGFLFDSPFGYVGFDSNSENFLRTLDELNSPTGDNMLPVVCESCPHKEEKLTVLFDSLDEYLEDHLGILGDEDDIMTVDSYDIVPDKENMSKLPKRIFRKDKKQMFDHIESFIWNSGLTKDEKIELNTLIDTIRKDEV